MSDYECICIVIKGKIRSVPLNILSSVFYNCIPIFHLVNMFATLERPTQLCHCFMVKLGMLIT